MTQMPEFTLAPGYYTDPSVFRREVQEIFARSWQMAGHVSQLPETGDYITLDFAAERVFVVRGQDGGAVATDAGSQGLAAQNGAEAPVSRARLRPPRSPGAGVG